MCASEDLLRATVYHARMAWKDVGNIQDVPEELAIALHRLGRDRTPEAAVDVLDVFNSMPLEARGKLPYMLLDELVVLRALERLLHWRGRASELLAIPQMP